MNGLTPTQACGASGNKRAQPDERGLASNMDDSPPFRCFPLAVPNGSAHCGRVRRARVMPTGYAFEEREAVAVTVRIPYFGRVATTLSQVQSRARLPYGDHRGA
ncbi:hypothetical protein GCM10009754_66800 [Amycolatopsis minnesotensis]|uniref:Uncharacterized protein n=1 Tax=Amycolatopsis minnesotensis TaxID=337894 RepID=A0ABN2S5M2_9PSEU